MADDRLQDVARAEATASNDNAHLRASSTSASSGSDRSLLTDLVMGLTFYSRLPVPGGANRVPDLNKIAPALGLTGLLIGIIPAAVLLALSPFPIPDFVVAAIAVGSWILVTGAMAEDAIADSADGLFGGSTIPKRLEILHDSRHGTYGVSALVLFVMIRTGLIAGALALSPLAAAGMWTAATLFSRSASLWLTLALPPARKSGAGATAGRIAKVPFWAGLAISGALAFILSAPAAGLWGFLGMIVMSALVCLGWTRLCRQLTGGQTGDLIGGLQALVESIALLTLVGAAGILAG